MKLGMCLAILAGPLSAKVDQGPFMRCAFDDGRIVVMAHGTEFLEWREKDFVGDVVQPIQMSHDPVLTFIGAWTDPERIDVFVGWIGPDAPEIEIGEALLSRTVISLDGKLESAAVAGLCEDYFG